MKKIAAVILICLILAGVMSTGPASTHAQFATPPATEPPIPIIPDGPDLTALAAQIEQYMMLLKFSAGTTRQGSVYLYDFGRDLSMEINPGVNYSAVSVGKIAVAATFLNFARATQDGVITDQQARLVAQMMLCSSNEASNALILMIGNGDPEIGLSEVRRYSADSLGAPLLITRLYSGDGSPDVVEGPVIPDNADADPQNQALTASLGTHLVTIITCAQSEMSSVSMIAAHPTDCRRLLNLMRLHRLNALIEGGIPPGTFIAHKQGWSQDTQGDAAYIVTPGGRYVLAIMLHQRKFLQSVGSFPAFAEVSRLVYNAYNPSAPMLAIRSQPIPKECPIPSQAIADLLKPSSPAVE